MLRLRMLSPVKVGNRVKAFYPSIPASYLGLDSGPFDWPPLCTLFLYFTRQQELFVYKRKEGIYKKSCIL
jgi:hypothetical protein